MKPKGAYHSKRTPLYTAFVNYTKVSGCKIAIKFNKNVLVLEQNNCADKIENTYIVCDLEDWSKIHLNSFKLKKCLFGWTGTLKNSDKRKYIYNDYEVAFDGTGTWSFCNCFAGNNVML